MTADPFCELASASTGARCLQPEVWLLRPPAPGPDAGAAAEVRACQSHARMLSRRGWEAVRELHPVKGFERTAP